MWLKDPYTIQKEKPGGKGPLMMSSGEEGKCLLPYPTNKELFPGFKTCDPQVTRLQTYHCTRDHPLK